jgi:hypothetical protein
MGQTQASLGQDTGGSGPRADKQEPSVPVKIAPAAVSLFLRVYEDQQAGIYAEEYPEFQRQFRRLEVPVCS